MSSEEAALSRRRLLQAVPVAGSVGVAGCTGLLEDDGGRSDDEESNGDEGEPETGSETEADDEPLPDPPSITEQIIQRDKAAITNIQHMVEGTVTWPSSRWVDPVDEALLGRWQSSNGEIVDFAADRSFAVDGDGPDYPFRGGYATRDNNLFLEYESGESQEWQYEITDWQSPPVLDLYFDGEYVDSYERTHTRADNRSPVRVANDLIVVRETNPTTEHTTLQSGGTGSGFIVTPDGYIVTNAHVVGGHQNSTEALFQRFALQNRDAFRQEFADDENLSEDERETVSNLLYEELMGYYEENAEIQNISESVNVLNGRARPDDDLEVETWEASVETQGTVYKEIDGEPTMGRDIAILKVDKENLPTVTLGSATDVGTGEECYVIGYPDLGLDEFFDERNTTLEPTMTTGIVSARRTLETGINSIQTDAAINSGNSGGPIYNSDGEVIGVATFSPPDVSIQDVQFGLPIEVAVGFLNELGVENTTGEMQTAYEEGLEAYWKGDCETATEQMEAVLDLYSDHPQAQEYITNCEAGDAPGQDS